MILRSDIEGNRLRLSRFLEQDISNQYLDWLADIKINKYLEVRFKAYSEKEAKNYIRFCNDSPNIYFLRILSKRGEFIGTCTINYNENHKTAEVGLMIGDTSFHNKGFGSEVIQILVEFCCSKLSVRKITSGLYESNTPSLKAFLKNGFVVESKLNSQVLLDGKPEDLYRLSYFCSAV